MAQLTGNDDGTSKYVIDTPLHGVWTHESTLANPPQTAPTLTNCELFGDVVRSMLGSKKFIADAWPSGTITLLVDYRSPGIDPVIIVGSSTGTIWKWSGAAWVTLRTGLTASALIWWATQQYGTDLFITNATDGIYRFDGTTLLPIGAKLVAQTDALTDWANATLDTADFQEGIASVKVQSSNPGASATMTYNPAAVIDTQTGRLSAVAYSLLKASGVDCYHFKVKFANGAGSTVTAATTTFAITDTGNKSLTWTAAQWHSTKSTAGAAIALNDNNWHDVYVFPSEATEVATFNPLLVDKLEFKVTTSAGQTFMLIDDIYSIYLTTMPAVQFLGEWRNILFGAYTTTNKDTLYWSPVRAPDQFSQLATAPIKGGGDAITALHPFFHQLTIGTDNHILTLSGNIIGQQYPAYLFDINEVTDECGISSHRSVVKMDNKLYFFYHHDLMSYTGTAVQDIGYPIMATLHTLDESSFQYWVGARHRHTDQIWWTVRTTGAAGVNNLVIKFDSQHDAFLLSDFSTPWFFITYKSGSEELLSIDDVNRFVYRQYDDTPGYKAFGTDIAYVIELTPQGMGDEAQEWIEAFIQYMSNVGTITVKYRQADHLNALAAASYVTLETINQAVAGELGRIRLGFPAKFCQLRLEVTGQPFLIQFPVIMRTKALGPERAYA